MRITIKLIKSTLKTPLQYFINEVLFYTELGNYVQKVGSVSSKVLLIVVYIPKESEPKEFCQKYITHVMLNNSSATFVGLPERRELGQRRSKVKDHRTVSRIALALRSPPPRCFIRVFILDNNF